MKLTDFKKHLKKMDRIRFQLPDGTFIPDHFHITEMGIISKSFLDCGGTMRHERVITFQLWIANDPAHRLTPKKVLGIIDLTERRIGLEDWDVEVEYQRDTIGKYGLKPGSMGFQLTNLQAQCLDPTACGIPQQKPKIQLSHLTNSPSCTPGSGCC